MKLNSLRRVFFGPVLVSLRGREFEFLACVVDAFTRVDEGREDVARHAGLVEIGVVFGRNEIFVCCGKLAPVESWFHVMDSVITVVEGKKVYEAAGEVARAVDGVIRVRVTAVVL